MVRLDRRFTIFGGGDRPPSAHFEPGFGVGPWGRTVGGAKMAPLFTDPGPRWPEVSIVLDKPSMRRAQGLASPARAATLKNDKPGIAIEGPQGPTNRRRA